MQALAWHFDFHSHESIRINQDPDVEGMATCLAEAGVEEIITFAKCHTGFAYYPSQVGNVHPKMAGDAFGDVVRACKSKGIKVLAYISFGIDGEAGRRHPEWAQVGDPATGPHISKDHFVAVCPYTPYIDTFMLPMIREILDGYPIDGFFFDTMGAMGVCHCKDCQADFRRVHGREIPRGPKDPDWGVYGEFRRERAWRVVGKVGSTITDRNPALKVGFNWVGTSRYPERMPEGVTCLTCDYNTMGPQSLQASFHAAYGKTSNLPCDVMYTVINRGWADWAPRSLAGLEQTGVTIWAHGCRPYLGDRLHPTNRLDPASAKAIRFMGDVQKRLAEHYPPADAVQPNEILMVIGPKAVYGVDMHRFATDHSGDIPVEGMHRLLLDAGYPVAIVPEDLLGERLSTARLAILSECEGLLKETEEALRHFVQDGGVLLITGQLPTSAADSFAWIGVTRERDPWQDHIYLPAWDSDGERTPVLVHGRFHCMQTAADVEILLPAIQPYDCSFGMRFGHGTGPASLVPSDVPALVRRRVGQGSVCYLEAPIGSAYERDGDGWQADWFRGLLERLIPNPIARVVSAAGSVEIVPHVNAAAAWAILINHGGEQLVSANRTSRTFPWVPPFPVTLELAIPPGREVKGVSAGGQPVEWERCQDTLRIPLTMGCIWTVVEAVWS